MRMMTTAVLAAALLLSASTVSAYELVKPKDQGGGPCKADGSECLVYCTNDDGSRGDLAGSMYWNGTYWTNGEQWSTEEDVEAENIVHAYGTACH